MDAASARVLNLPPHGNQFHGAHLLDTAPGEPCPHDQDQHLESQPRPPASGLPFREGLHWQQRTRQAPGVERGHRQEQHGVKRSYHRGGGDGAGQNERSQVGDLAGAGQPGARPGQEKETARGGEQQKGDRPAFGERRHPVAAWPGIGGHAFAVEGWIFRRDHRWILHGPVAGTDAEHRIRTDERQAVAPLEQAAATAPLLVVRQPLQRVRVGGVAAPVERVGQAEGEDRAAGDRQEGTTQPAPRLLVTPQASGQETEQHEDRRRDRRRQPRGA